MKLTTKDDVAASDRQGAVLEAIREQTKIAEGGCDVLGLKPNERVAKRKTAWYSAEPIPKRLHTSAKKRSEKQKTRLRSSLQPGTVLVMLAGRFRGKRVVFLRQLEQSGLLLVTGPFVLNGVPIRRVNHAYVIATKTRIDVSGLDTSAIDDGWFTKGAKKARAERKQARLRGDGNEKAEVDSKQALPEEKKEMQKLVDGQVLKAIESVPHLREYLSSRFTLTKGQYPHQMVF
ncbi:60S ribosomal protein L6 [Cyanidiococcus yangmingshanensis]|uniref:60S ribosomal protein L6 n=1 Tax=Cyanidiococcus yangmingshanensis TaxID=2690220 RepID=A0A7J7IQB1_9RHOD|nr:60S ribosomal protein L6 [Cyanidiococcus yangmingshanensis]